MASTHHPPADCAGRTDASGVAVDLLSAAAHELRTPLTSIFGFVATLVAHHEQMTTSAVHEALVILERQTKRLASMLDQLLELGERDRGGSLRSAVDLAEVVNDALESAPPPAGVTVTVTVAPGEAPLVVSSELLAMTRVLINLLTNAYKYGGPNVAVSSRKGTSDVTLTVEDDGAGVAGWLVPDLFEPFVRGGNGALPHPSGNGLGLALARTIVESFDGRLTYEPAAPHGARFTMTMPAKDVAVTNARLTSAN